jgi:hypothetical protein
MFYFALCRGAWDEMLMWASEKITHVCADQPHLRNDLPALVERLNGEARAPRKFQIMCQMSLKSANCGDDVWSKFIRIQNELWVAVPSIYSFNGQSWFILEGFLA